MKQSRIFKHLEELDIKNQEKFRQFAASPYFNQHRETSRLLRYLLEHLQKNKVDKMSREAAFAAAMPGQKYDDQQLHNLLSNLKKLYLKFLAQQYLERHNNMEQVLTLESAFELNQFKLMDSRARQLEKRLDKQSYQDAEYHYAQYRLHHLRGYYLATYIDRSKTDAMERMLHHLDRYYILEKLRNSCHLTANMVMMNTQYNFSFLEPLLNYIETQWPEFEADTSIVLYYTILMSMREEHNPIHYQGLKALLSGELTRLSPLEKQDLYTFANNYCIRRINRGDEDYQKELFELYQQGLDNQLLLSNGLMDEFSYKNICTLACTLEEFEWTQQFLEKYKELLPEHRRENAYNYNLAYLYYRKKQYQKVPLILQRVQFVDVKYNLNTYFLLLRTYHDQGETDAMLNLIESFRIYVIRNKKMTTEQKKGHTNFLRFAKRLTNLREQEDFMPRQELQKRFASLRKQVEETDNVINRMWLLQEMPSPPAETLSETQH